LAEGELVQFNLIQGSKGPEATDITGMDGVPVQGSEFARPKNSNSITNDTTNNTSGDGSINRPIRTSRSNVTTSKPFNYDRLSYNNNNNTNSNNKSSSYRNQRPRTNSGGPPKQRRPQVSGTNAGGTNGYGGSSNRSSGGYGGSNSNQYNSNDYNYRPPKGGRQQQSPYTYDNQRQPAGNNYQYSNVQHQNMRSAPHYYDNNYIAQGGFDMPPPPAHTNGGYYAANQQRLPPQNQHQYQPPPANLMNMPNRLTGLVKWYNYKNGYGFITRNDNNQDVFVHRSGIQSNNNAMTGLDDGEPVEFNIFNDGNQVLAINVTGPNGSILRGSKYAAPSSFNNNNLNGSQQENVPTKVYRRRKAPMN